MFEPQNASVYKELVATECSRQCSSNSCLSSTHWHSSDPGWLPPVSVSTQFFVFTNCHPSRLAIWQAVNHCRETLEWPTLMPPADTAVNRIASPGPGTVNLALLKLCRGNTQRLRFPTSANADLCISSLTSHSLHVEFTCTRFAFTATARFSWHRLSF